jgi:hypothetical protein
MTKPTLYKKIAISLVGDRPTNPLNSVEKTQVNQTVSKFFELFIQKHI